MPSSALLKSGLHNSVAKGLYNEIQNRTAKYYYFLGKTLQWPQELDPPYPINSLKYDLDTRNEIITMKEIRSTDVAFVVERINWESGLVYDMYDDHYCDELDGINLISGGYGFADPPTVIITGGGGSGASAVAHIANGIVIEIEMTNPGRGYTSTPTVTITGGGGEGAAATAVLPVSYTGKQKMEQCKFYVVTDEYNVYKCLDNNNNAISTYKPVGTTVDPVIMPDGYMWKYMYSIPIALRNKFLTDSYMPVVTALRPQFYSSGAIQTVKIDKRGQGYTYANISVQGDGCRELDPLFIIGANLSANGSGYTSATVDIDPPFASTAYAANINVLLGQKFRHNNNIYEVTLPGTLALPAPTHGSGIVSNGTAALKYIGTTAKATATVSGGQITAINLIGAVREVIMTDGGLGYTSAPTVTFSGGSGSGATASVIMMGTSVQTTVITNSGDNYTSTPTVTFGTPWTAATSLTLQQQVYVANRLYTVTAAGTTGSVAPTHTSGSASSGTATLTYVGRPASGTVILRYGTGYSVLPDLTINSTTGSGATGYLSGVKSEAKILPLLSNGELVGIQIDDGGIGYTYANLTVDGDGEDAEISADLSPGDVSTLQANTELLTVDGRIMSIKVVSGGFGYAGATITIAGDGTGATAEAITENGKIKKIRMTNYGQGYRWARVTITGSGFGASARAIMTDFGGHGKDSINGLYTRSLMFYSSISRDKNQGFDVNNDFRQIGIIKNPRKFQSTYSLDSTLASACFVVTGSINTNNFSKDQTIYLSNTGAKFRIVNLNSNSALLQSLDNAIPTVGSVLTNDASQTFSVSGLTLPTVDKYSGDLLFIDNKQAFTPTADQTVTLRTVVKF
jgi:hypothetical protein